MQIFLHRMCWAAKLGDKIFRVLAHDLLWSLPVNLKEYHLMVTSENSEELFLSTHQIRFLFFLQLPTESYGVATAFKVQGRNPDLRLFAGFCALFAGFCALFACTFPSWMYHFVIEKLSMGLEGEEVSKLALELQSLLQLQRSKESQFLLLLKIWMEGWHLD